MVISLAASSFELRRYAVNEVGFEFGKFLNRFCLY